LLSPGFFI